MFWRNLLLPPSPQLPPTRRHLPKDHEASDTLDKTAMILEYMLTGASPAAICYINTQFVLG